MRYEGKIYRPPGEWRSYLLQCTVGCTHNKCTFCGMYKEKKFHVRPMKEIMEDIAMARVYYDPATVDKVFLCDGDAIVMRQEQLLQILEALYAAFPNLRQVTTYAGTRSTKTKSLEQLKELRQAGLTRAYLGVETGWDDLLKKVNKGVTSAEMIEATDMLKEAGMDL
ncbi:MAG: radical SAM protein, partial [Ruminiclostridium sp.]|nr:radical SAM protein [Ruminiclostridium sp.]